MIFSPSQLQKFLLYAKEVAPIVTLQNASNKNEIILRHDVDISLKSAFEVAKLEEKLNITSSFFVMVTNPLYNVFTKKNRDYLKEISKRGFEVGLHFDSEVYDDSGDLEDCLDMESEMLGEIVDTKICSVSLHNPVEGRYLEFKKYNNAYSVGLSDTNYLSDSRMDFRVKNLYEFVKRATHISIQLLLHPAHWIGEDRDYVEICHESVQDFISDADTFFKVNSRYRQCIEGSTLHKKIKELEVKLCLD